MTAGDSRLFFFARTGIVLILILQTYLLSIYARFIGSGLIHMIEFSSGRSMMRAACRACTEPDVWHDRLHSACLSSEHILEPCRHEPWSIRIVAGKPKREKWPRIILLVPATDCMSAPAHLFIRDAKGLCIRPPVYIPAAQGHGAHQ